MTKEFTTAEIVLLLGGIEITAAQIVTLFGIEPARRHKRASFWSREQVVAILQSVEGVARDAQGLIDEPLQRPPPRVKTYDTSDL